MSKMDDMRAMREARYEQRMARAAKPLASRTTVARPAAEPAEAQPPEADPEVQLCGHRSINGRNCTREHGHAAKSHRYS